MFVLIRIFIHFDNKIKINYWKNGHEVKDKKAEPSVCSNSFELFKNIN
jgi:hypothetical protein